MASAELSIEARVYWRAAAAFLWVSYRLAPLVGPRNAERCANLAVHWFLWSRTAGRWERVGKNVTVTMWWED